MPIHLIWGDDAAARDRAINALIERVVDPSWSSLNLSRLDGAGVDPQALEEAEPSFAAAAPGAASARSVLQWLFSELADR